MTFWLTMYLLYAPGAYLKNNEAGPWYILAKET